MKEKKEETMLTYDLYLVFYIMLIQPVLVKNKNVVPEVIM